MCVAGQVVKIGVEVSMCRSEESVKTTVLQTYKFLEYKWNAKL